MARLFNPILAESEWQPSRNQGNGCDETKLLRVAHGIFLNQKQFWESGDGAEGPNFALSRTYLSLGNLFCEAPAVTIAQVRHIVGAMDTSGSDSLYIACSTITTSEGEYAPLRHSCA